MSNAVVYEVSMNDMLTDKLRQADGAAEHLEGTMHGVSNILGALGVGFALFQGIEFVHQGIESMHQLHDAEAQVEAGLKSTHEAAHETFAELEISAKSLAGQFKFTRAEIFDMQSQLLTFPVITKRIFPETEQAVLDMATRLHKGFDEVAIMVGKALQDPARGITALRRVGVNFNEHQTEVIKKMVETGHIGQAQIAILKELSNEFAGSAKAAADADPLFRFNKLMGSIKLGVGELAMELLHSLQPILESIAQTFKDALSWIGENKDLLIKFGEVVLVAVGALTAYKVIMLANVAITKMAIIWEKIQYASITLLGEGFLTAGAGVKFFAGAWEMLTVAIESNPFGAVLTALAAITAAYFAFSDSAKAAAKNNDKLNQSLQDTIALSGEKTDNLIFEMAEKYGKNGVKGFDKAGHAIRYSVQEGNKLLQEEIFKQIDMINSSAILDKRGMLNLKDATAIQELMHYRAVLARGPKHIGGDADTGLSDKQIGKQTSKVTGNKSVNIHIAIGNLIKDFSFNVKNVKDGMSDVKGAVVQTLLSAVNDSQIVAGQ